MGTSRLRLRSVSRVHRGSGTDVVFICDSKTLQTTEAKFLSGFGWGLTKKIESYGLAKFKSNLQRVCRMLDYRPIPMLTSIQSREGFFVILGIIRQSRMQPMTMGAPNSFLAARSFSSSDTKASAHPEVPANGDSREDAASSADSIRRGGYWTRWRSWLG